MSKTNHTEVAIVGAGIVGLAHAYLAARAGRRVTVFERNPVACGASIRNFGMIWPIGQPAGTLHDMAMRSRALWVDVLDQAKLPHTASGSLHVAYLADEEEVGREFAERAAAATSSGLIDGVGYLGGALAGVGVARLAIAFGWRGVFAALAVVSFLSAVASAYLLIDQKRVERRQQMVRF